MRDLEREREKKYEKERGHDLRERAWEVRPERRKMRERRWGAALET